jgi:ParB family chromosome partitioning protein
MSEQQPIVEVDIDNIIIPRDRVTSVFDPDTWQEFLESVKENGIIMPILVMKVNGQLHLIDGLHRIEAAKQLGIRKIKAIIREGDETMLAIENIISARQRGRENKAQTAKVVKLLHDKYGFSWKDIGRKLGMSAGTVKDYYDITRLPEEVLELVGRDLLSISKARLLLSIPDPRDQVNCARDIVRYGYNESLARELVQHYVNAYYETDVIPQTPTLVRPETENVILCVLCKKPMNDKLTYYWVHEDCIKKIAGEA